MNELRRLMWGAFALAAAAWAGFAVTTNDERAVLETPVPLPTELEASPVGTSASIEAALPGHDVSASGPSLQRDPLPASPSCEGDVPAHELERGRATLRLRLRSDRGGDPVAMDIRLWRLGVAEDLNWTAGDEVRATCDVPKAGWRFERLPPGSYRVQCLDARYGVADPGMFSLTDGDHDVTLDVADRRTHRQRVSLVAQDGSPILSSASAAGGAVQALGGTPGAPTWVSPRSSKSRPPFDPRMGFGVGHKYSVDPPTPVSVEPDGWFALDPFFDRGPGGYHRWSWKYTTEGRASVYVGCDDALSRDIAFVGVAASLDTVVAGVSYPTGHPVNPGSVTIEAHCSAIQCAWDPPADAWRTIPVHVTVQVKGYEPLVFDWTAATADQRHVLVAKSPESQK